MLLNGTNKGGSMRKLIMVLIILGVMTSVGYAQTMTKDDINYVKILRSTQSLKKQIEAKEVERVDAINVVKIQYKTELDNLESQLTSAEASLEALIP